MNRLARLPSPSIFAGFTTAEFLRIVDSGAFGDLRVELVGGEIVKMMPSYLAHGEANMKLGARLMQAFGAQARVAVDLMIATASDTIRAADLAVVQEDAPRDRPVPPTDVLLAVEIAATTLPEDLGFKLADYAASGIESYWVVDLGGRVTHVMQNPEGDSYRDRLVVRFGEPIAVPGTDATIVID